MFNIQIFNYISLVSYYIVPFFYVKNGQYNYEKRCLWQIIYPPPVPQGGGRFMDHRIAKREGKIRGVQGGFLPARGVVGGQSPSTWGEQSNYSFVFAHQKNKL